MLLPVPSKRNDKIILPDIILALDDWITTHHKLTSAYTQHNTHHKSEVVVSYYSPSTNVKKAKKDRDLDEPWFWISLEAKKDILIIGEHRDHHNTIKWTGQISDPDFMEGFTKAIHQRVVSYQARLLVKRLNNTAIGLIETAEPTKIETYIKKIKECTEILMSCNEAKFKKPRKKHNKS